MKEAVTPDGSGTDDTAEEDEAEKEPTPPPKKGIRRGIGGKKTAVASAAASQSSAKAKSKEPEPEGDSPPPRRKLPFRKSAQEASQKVMEKPASQARPVASVPTIIEDDGSETDDEL